METLEFCWMLTLLALVTCKILGCVEGLSTRGRVVTTLLCDVNVRIIVAAMLLFHRPYTKLVFK
jgi:hypothetical protein